MPHNRLTIRSSFTTLLSLRKISILLFVILVSISCINCTNRNDGGTAGEIAYCASEASLVGQFTAPYNLAAHDMGLNIAWPTTGTAPYPVVVFVPGINDQFFKNLLDGDVDYFDDTLLQRYATAGIVAISINYRQGDIIEMVEDVSCAIRWVKAHALTTEPMHYQADPEGAPIIDPSRVEMDPDNIVLVGHSLGGIPAHLVGAGFVRADLENKPGWFTDTPGDNDKKGYRFTGVSSAYTDSSGEYDRDDISTVAIATVNSLSDILATMTGFQWVAVYNPLNPYS